MSEKEEMDKIKRDCIIPVFECPECFATLFVHPFRLPDNSYRLWCDTCNRHIDEKELKLKW